MLFSCCPAGSMRCGILEDFLALKLREEEERHLRLSRDFGAERGRDRRSENLSLGNDQGPSNGCAFLSVIVVLLFLFMKGMNLKIGFTPRSRLEGKT
uniref:Uncharacterized protein n=1 Tax=Cucumis melo TaxID=3656 RepID=A0A9I9E7R1_CUCME